MSLLKRKMEESGVAVPRKKQARVERKPRVSFAFSNVVRQPSLRDEEGNPVPVGPEHFGVEPMKEPPKPKRFLQKKFFFKILHRIAKADKNRSRGRVAEKTQDWMTVAYARDLILEHKKDDTMSVREVVESLLAFLSNGIRESRAQQKKFMIGDFKLPHEWLQHYLGDTVATLQEILRAEQGAAESAAKGAASKFTLKL